MFGMQAIIRKCTVQGFIGYFHSTANIHDRMHQTHDIVHTRLYNDLSVTIDTYMYWDKQLISSYTIILWSYIETCKNKNHTVMLLLCGKTLTILV